MSLARAEAYAWTVVLAACAAACGSSHSTVCTFNSDCAAGRYCTAAGSCTADCSADTECVTSLGAGAICTSFGMCVGAPDAGIEVDGGQDGGTATDGGRRDGGPLDAGADAGPPPESCTRSTPGSVAVDEDGDGEIDEGCPWHFGEPQPVFSLPCPAAGGLVESPRLSVDGLRLFARTWIAGATPAGHPAVASRASLDAPFGPPVALDYIPGSEVGVSSFDLDDAELEMWAQVGTSTGQDLAVARRTSTTASFGPLMPLTVLNDPAANDHHPYLRSDGLELLFASSRSGVPLLYRTTRAAVAADFGAPELLAIESPTPLADLGCASLSSDGLTLFFCRGGVGNARLFLTHRTSRDSARFGPAQELAELNSATGHTIFATVHESTREVFFVSNRDWAPGVGGGVWRAEICRDGPCVNAYVPCDTGVRSPDGLHCYFPGPTLAGTNAEARFACASSGGHLPTVTSEAERALLWSRWGGGPGVYLWLAGTDEGHEGTWRWDWTDRVSPEEPWVFARWGGSEPNNYTGFDLMGENFLELNGDLAGLLNDRHGGFSGAYACEREVWPTW